MPEYTMEEARRVDRAYTVLFGAEPDASDSLLFEMKLIRHELVFLRWALATIAAAAVAASISLILNNLGVSL